MYRPDYEIYTFTKDGIKYWAFDVEYFGHYTATSEQEILQKLERVKLRVQLKLEEIERANQEYYRSIARAQSKTRAELRAQRMRRKKWLQ